MDRKYARIQDGMVVEFLSTELNIQSLFYPSLTWVDVSDADPGLDYGWLASEGESGWTFRAPDVPNVPPV